jgi:hypothetical protein
MPRVNQYQSIEFEGFAAGLDKHADSSRLDLDEMSEAMDVRIGPRGEVKLRTGYTRRDTNLEAPAQFLYSWRDAYGDDLLFGVTTGSQLFYAREDSSHYPIGPTLYHGNDLQRYGVGFAGAEKNLYVTSKMSPVQKFNSYDGWQTPPSDMPNGKMMHYRHNRMFIINTEANSSRIWYSELGDVENFPPDNWIDVDPDDGYEINASEVYGDDLIVFKDRAIWKLSGRTPSSFSLYRIDNDRGCVSPEATAQLRGKLIFLDRETGIWAFDGSSLELVSELINDYILKGLSYKGAWADSMYSGDDRLYVSINWGDGTTRRSFVYHADVDGWTEYSRGFTGNAVHMNRRNLGFRFRDGLWIADDESTTHEGQPIVAKWRTGWQLLGGPGVKARVRRLELTVKSNVGSTGTIRMYRDYNDVTPYIVRTFEGGPDPRSLEADERRVTIDGWGNRVHAVMFEFEYDEPPFQINEFSVLYTGGIDIRGRR